MPATPMIGNINPRLVFLLVFVGLVGYLLYKDRDKIQRQSILFYRRTKHGVEHIDKIAKAAPRFWNIYGWTGVLVGVLSIPFILYNVFLSFENMIQTGGSSGGPSLIAPGLGSEATFQSGVSFVPAEYWIIGIAVIMFVHELSHGIVARAEGMEINSVGWIILGIIPGAFVEPKGENMLPGDEEEGSGDKESDSDSSGSLWDQGSLGSRLKVLAAGSFANYLTSIAFAALALVLFVNVTQPLGVIYSAQDGFPAQEAGMDNGTIYSIDGERIRYSGELSEKISNHNPGDVIKINTSEGIYNVELGERNNTTYLGVGYYPNEGIWPAFIDMVQNRREIAQEYESYESLLSWAISGLETISLLNLLIGLFNMLPAKPLDGGQMVSAVLEKYLPSSIDLLNYWSLLVWIALIGAMIFGIGGLF